MITIEACRQEIDEIDFEIVKLLKERSLIVESVGKVKIEQKISVMQENRVVEMLVERKRLAKSLQIEQEFIEDLFKRIISHSCEIEEKMKVEKEANK